MAQAQVNARAETELAVQNLLLAEGKLLAPPPSPQLVKKKKRRAPGVKPQRNQRNRPAKRMKKTMENPSRAAEVSSIFASLPESQAIIPNTVNTTLISPNLVPTSTIPLSLPSDRLDTLSHLFDFVVSDISAGSEYPNQTQIVSSNNSATFPTSNTIVADISSILMLFSNIFDVFLAPQILSTSGLISDSNSNIRIFLYRQFLFKEFHQSIRNVLASSSSSFSVNSTAVSSNIISLDNLLQIFLDSSRKLGITPQSSVSS